MATATMEYKNKTELVTRQVRTGVTLTLSNHEAVILQSLLRKVGGSYARDYVKGISNALEDQGVPYNTDYLHGSITCEAGSLSRTNVLASKMEAQ